MGLLLRAVALGNGSDSKTGMRSSLLVGATFLALARGGGRLTCVGGRHMTVIHRPCLDDDPRCSPS